MHKDKIIEVKNIKKICREKEILDIDLQDKDVQLNLSAAYKICKYILQGNIDI